jgi:hypothetical protein
MLLQHTALFGYGIAYTITASISCRYARLHPLLRRHVARAFVIICQESRPPRARDSVVFFFFEGSVILWWRRGVAGPPHVARRADDATRPAGLASSGAGGWAVVFHPRTRPPNVRTQRVDPTMGQKPACRTAVTSRCKVYNHPLGPGPWV